MQFQKWTQELFFCSIFLPVSSQGFGEDEKLDLEGTFCLVQRVSFLISFRAFLSSYCKTLGQPKPKGKPSGKILYTDVCRKTEGQIRGAFSAAVPSQENE